MPMDNIKINLRTALAAYILLSNHLMSKHVIGFYNK